MTTFAMATPSVLDIITNMFAMITFISLFAAGKICAQDDPYRITGPVPYFVVAGVGLVGTAVLVGIGNPEFRMTLVKVSCAALLLAVVWGIAELVLHLLPTREGRCDQAAASASSVSDTAARNHHHSDDAPNPSALMLLLTDHAALHRDGADKDVQDVLR